MQRSTKMLAAIAIAVLCLTVVWGVNANPAVDAGATTPTATVSTDKADYLPGEFVEISGTGWMPGEPVALTITESDGDAPYQTTATADDQGNIFSAAFAPESHDLGVSFTLNAVGQLSGQTASTTFTDGNPALNGYRNVAASWGGTLNGTNSQFKEGDYIPSRYILPSLTGGTATGGTNYIVQLKWDFGQLSNTEHLVDWIGNFQGGAALACDGFSSPNCTSTSTPSLVTIPTDDSTDSNSRLQPNSQEAGKLSVFGPSGMTVTFVCPSTNPATDPNPPACTANGYQTFTVNGGNGGNTQWVKALTLRINVPKNTTGDVVIAYGSHLAKSGSGATDWPAGQGASSWPGGSGHIYGNFNLNTSDDNVGISSGAIVATTTTTVSSSNNPSNFGDPVTFTATVTSTNTSTLAGSVQFVVDGSNFGSPVTLSGGAANSQTTMTLSVGSHSVSATFTPSGSCTCTTSSGSLPTQVVNNPGTTITVSPASGTYGGTVNLSATLTKQSDSSALSGKTVSFTLNGTGVGSATTNASGVATLTNVSLGSIAVGSYGTGVGASFAGDGTYLASSGTASLTVGKAPLTITASSGTKTFGDTYTVTASYSGFVNSETNSALTTQPTCTSAGSAATASVSGSPYTTSCSGAAAANYSINYVSGSLTINKANVTCTVTGYTTTYDASAHTATGSCTGVGGASVSGLDLSGTTHTNAGTYNDSWTFTDSTGNYNNTSGNVADTINKANASITVTPYSVTYDGSAHTAAGTATGVGGADLSASLNLSGTTHTNAGTYNGDVWTFTGGTNYNDSTGTVNDAIAKANATIHITPYHVTYDANPHTATGTATGVQSEDLSSLLTLSGTTHTNAGTYSSDPWSFAGNGNYNSASGSVTDIIDKADAHCSVTGYSTTYDATAHTATGSCTGVDSGILGGLDLSGTTHTDAGGYNDSWTFTDSTGNYNNNGGSLTDSIAKANASITVTPYHVTYNGAAHTATGTATGVGGVDLSGGLNLSGTTHTDAGAYNGDAWTFSGGNNYNDANGSVNDAIDKANATIIVNGYSGTYDGSAHGATGSATGVLGENLNSLLHLGGSFTNVVTAPVNWSFDGNNNYNSDSGTVQIVIMPKMVNVSADPQTKVYGSADPTLTYHADALIGSDSYSGSLSRAAGEDVGSYAISQGTLTAGSNYVINFTGANLTITKATVTVTADNKSKNYGDANPAFTASYSGFVFGQTFATSGITGSPSLTTDATSASPTGSYTITAANGTLSSNNYAFSFVNGTLTVSAKAITIAAGAKSKTYGNADPALTYSINPALVNGDTATGSLVRAAGEDVGSYAISQGSVTVNSNYSVTFVGANLVINPDPTALTVLGIPSVSELGDPVYVTATASTTNGQIPTGTADITIWPGAAGVGTPLHVWTGLPLINGVATSPTVTDLSLSTGRAITAIYNPNTADFLSSNGSFVHSVVKRPTTLTRLTGFPNAHSFVNFDCINDVIKFQLTDTETGAPIPNATVQISVGSQSSGPLTTDASGIATWVVVLNQPSGNVALTATYAGDSTFVGQTSTQTVTIAQDPFVVPLNGTSLYTGSGFFWTTSSSSSTSTLTLSATVKDSSTCPGDISKANVTFLASTSATGPFKPVATVPVGYVNPTDKTVGTASAIAQYDIGSSQSVTIYIQVVVGGEYKTNPNEPTAISPVTISKPGVGNELLGGGTLNNDGNPFYANGYLGLNSAGSSVGAGRGGAMNAKFGSQVTYNKSGTNPQGQMNIDIYSYNKADGSPDTVLHHYWIKSNSISELTFPSAGVASFGAKTNVFELTPDGNKTGLDGGGTMQVVFVNQGKPFPSPTPLGTTCTFAGGCASITIFRSSSLGGGLWYSSAWGPATASALPSTNPKQLVNGNVVVQ